MDRTAFLEKFFKMYPSSFNENNIPVWWDIYEGILPINVDFDKLFHHLVTEWQSTGTAPAPTWFNDSHTVNSAKSNKCVALRHMEEIKQTAEPMPESFKLKIQELKQKMSMGAR